MQVRLICERAICLRERAGVVLANLNGVQCIPKIASNQIVGNRRGRALKARI